VSVKQSSNVQSARSPSPRGTLLLGAVVNALIAVVLLLLAWLYECLQMIHVLLGLVSGGTSVLMVRAASAGTDPGGDDHTDGPGGQNVDREDP